MSKEIKDELRLLFKALLWIISHMSAKSLKGTERQMRLESELQEKINE